MHLRLEPRGSGCHLEMDEKVAEQLVKLTKAVLLSFRLNPMQRIAGAPGEAFWWDKVPSKFAAWGDRDFAEAGFRAVPGSI